MTAPLRIGTRGSDLALWQANFVAGELNPPGELVIIKTSGDRIQGVALHEVEGVGFFTKEIEQELQEGRVDLAIHSYKDLPTQEPPELTVAAIPARGPVRDVLVHREQDLSQRWGLPQGARVGTSSLRRRAQILALRPDVTLVELRGNVPTRFNKVVEGELDAVVLAEAGLHRLGMLQGSSAAGVHITPLQVNEVCPAPSQGALAIQIRRGDERAAKAVAHIHNPVTAQAARMERALLSHFGGGCHLPLGAYARPEGGTWLLSAIVASPTGDHRITAEASGDDEAALVASVHQQLLQQGAEAYL